VHFDGDRAPFDAEHRGRTDSGNHAASSDEQVARVTPTNEGGNGNRFPDG
jgi:hypothetical protein